MEATQRRKSKKVVLVIFATTLMLVILCCCGCVGIFALLPNDGSKPAAKKVEVQEPVKVQTPVVSAPRVDPIPEQPKAEVFRLFANDFRNSKVDVLLKKYTGSYVKEEQLPNASQFYLKNSHVNLSASYKKDTKIVNNFTTELLGFQCEIGKRYTTEEINKYLTYLNVNTVDSSQVEFNDASGVTSVKNVSGWNQIVFNCFETDRVDVTFLQK